MFSFSPINDIFEKEVRKRKLEKLQHVRVNSSTFEALTLLVNYQLLNNAYTEQKIPKELKEDICKYTVKNKEEIRTAYAAFIPVEQKTVWPRSQTQRAVIEDLPTTIEIKLPNEGIIYLWTFYTKAAQHDGDALWTHISFDNRDRTHVEKFLELLEQMRATIYARERYIQVCGGTNIKIKDEHSWDDLILPPHIIRSVKDDLEFWIKMESQYKEKRIPYRRGYLFEGPPGNGKTAVSRVILSSYDFTGFMFNFSNSRLDDSDLVGAFEEATNSAPSVFLLEDIDRVFDKSRFCNISLEGLFNCLDGISVNDGVVVIATANYPEMLDKAIRQRPGRFDVPVHFDNPDADQRNRFFTRMFGGSISDDVLSRITSQTSGMSMAFLKSVYETSGVHAFKRSNNGKLIINDVDAIAGLEMSLKYYRQMEIGEDRAAGFTSDSNKTRPYNETARVQEEGPPYVSVTSNNGGASFSTTPTR